MHILCFSAKGRARSFLRPGHQTAELCLRFVVYPPIVLESWSAARNPGHARRGKQGRKCTSSPYVMNVTVSGLKKQVRCAHEVMLRTKSSFRSIEIERACCRSGVSPRESPFSAAERRFRWDRKLKREHTRRYFSMHRDGPVTRLPIGAAPGKKPGLRACLMLMLGAGMICATALAAAAPGAKPAPAQAKDAAPADFVGAETCATCHEEVAKGFASNPHSKLAEQHGKTGVTCEGCHGAGRAHVEGGGDKTKIFNPATATAKEVDDKCLGCHQGKHANFERSAHGEGNVGCVGCHSVHAGSNDVRPRSICSRLPSPRSASSATPTSSRSSPCPSTTRSTRG